MRVVGEGENTREKKFLIDQVGGSEIVSFGLFEANNSSIKRCMLKGRIVRKGSIGMFQKRSTGPGG